MNLYVIKGNLLSILVSVTFLNININFDNKVYIKLMKYNYLVNMV